MNMPANPLYGRMWDLQVTLPNGGTVFHISNSTNSNSALRVKFDVRTVFYQVAWWAEIDVYNLDATTTQSLIASAGTPPEQVDFGQGVVALIAQNMICQLKAGYQQPGKFGTIWSGPVFQALFEREQAIDFKITLRCLLWLDPLTRTSVNTAFGAYTTQTALIQQLAAQAFTGYSKPQISLNLPPNGQSRGGVLFGGARGFLDDIAVDNNMQWYFGPKGLVVGSPDDNIAVNATPVTFSPPPLPAANTAGPPVPLGANGVIIGTPQQTQYGVRFTALLDPTVVVDYPAMQVKIDNSQIVLLKKQQGELPGFLDQSGTYIAVGVRYVGDTRGLPWYVEIDGLTSVNGKLAMLQYLAQEACTNGCSS
jgi:hypothetical protein